MKVIFIIVIVISQTCLGQTFHTLESEYISSSLSYTMKNPIHSWTGSIQKFSCKILFDLSEKSIKKVDVEASVVSFDSDIKIRDGNAFKTLEVNLFPNVSFSSNKIIEKNQEVFITGVLSFHGIRKEITFLAKKNYQKNLLSVIGNFSIKLTDFDLKPPSLIGLKAENSIVIKFLINFVLPQANE